MQRRPPHERPETEVPPTPGERVPSFGQERLWFLDQLEPATGVYNIAQAIHLQGELNREALRQALDGVISRHETL